MSEELGWGREVFSLSVAVQMLCWGITQPLAGIGGRLYDIYQDYSAVWWMAVALGLAATLIHLPIREEPGVPGQGGSVIGPRFSAIRSISLCAGHNLARFLPQPRG